MAETPPYGEKFGKSVKHILHREGQWNLWKNQGCKSLISKPTVAEEEAAVKKEDGAESKDSNNAAMSTIPIFFTYPIRRKNGNRNRFSWVLVS